jgi:hypothetical protein
VLVLAFLVAGLPGCASVATNAAVSIVEADEAMVSGCEFLGAVYGRTVYGGFANNLAVNNAKIDAREKAAKLGATHLVFLVVDGGGWERQGHTQARAYRCKG